ncbi:type I methionyl aminopeptidase [Nakamurella aerolata]
MRWPFGSGSPGRKRRIELKTRGELQAMRASGLTLAGILDSVRGSAAAGITTGRLDEVARQALIDAGATSSFLGYQGFPAAICTSVNDEVIHGIPGDRVLQAGDLLSVDAGCIVDGWHADAAWSIVVPGDPAQMDDDQNTADQQLIDAAWAALWAGVAAAKAGARLGDVSAAIEAAAGDYAPIKDFGGHGIGTAMHMDPYVANRGKPGRGQRLVPGTALAIEPMLAAGRGAVSERSDGWTVVTRDGRRGAHVEHTIAVLSDGVTVLTARDRGASGLSELGVEPVNLDL